jgi:hypothetical protein
VNKVKAQCLRVGAYVTCFVFSFDRIQQLVTIGECQYSRFIGRLSSHVVSDVAARWSPEARVLCSPVVVCYGFWRSGPHQV